MLSTLGQSLMDIWEVDLKNLSDQLVRENEEKIENDRKKKIFREREKGGTEILISEIIRFELAYRSE